MATNEPQGGKEGPKSNRERAEEILAEQLFKEGTSDIVEKFQMVLRLGGSLTGEGWQAITAGLTQALDAKDAEANERVEAVVRAVEKVNDEHQELYPYNNIEILTSNQCREAARAAARADERGKTEDEVWKAALEAVPRKRYFDDNEEAPEGTSEQGWNSARQALLAKQQERKEKAL